MRICFIPIDNRPVCYNLIKDICDIDGAIELNLPPREFLGSLKKNADIDSIYEWFKTVEADIIIISLDTIAYGGLIPSRRGVETKQEVLNRLEKFREIWTKKDAKIFALSSIMRISNNNYNEEEKEYWKEYGKKIFEWSFNGCKPTNEIPESIIKDYLKTRTRNFEINKTLLEWKKQGFFEELIFTKDDCAESGLNIKEAKELESMGAKVITGADEIPITLLSKAIKKKISVQPIFIEKDKHLKSNYEDVSIEQCVINQLKLAEIDIVSENPDIVMVVNNFKTKQGELVMDWETEQFSGEFELPDKPYIIADVRNANGADNKFVECILPQINLENFYGYSAWNTSANTIGTLICIAKMRFNAEKYNDRAFRHVEMIRLLDDWAYQANVRENGKVGNITELMKPYETKVKDVLGLDKIKNSYLYPWDRSFEIEVVDELY